VVHTGDRVKGALRLRGGELRWGVRTYIMGVVNVTPDSFSGDGLVGVSDAAAHATEQWRAGAHILDVGGESTRPGHHVVDDNVEIARVIPVIRAFRAAFPAAPISIDTYKPAVVRAAHAAGADLVNSVWGVPAELLEVVADLGMPIVAMHNQNGTQYDGAVVDAVLTYLDDCASRAVARGIAPDRIILDPGIGFGKTAEHNIAVLDALPRLVGLGFPTLIGTSRKSTLGKLIGREPNDRVYATVATTAFAIAAGVDVVRVHDVRAARDAAAVTDALVRGWRPDGWIE
jgi:dihydropteroate synthase